MKNWILKTTSLPSGLTASFCQVRSTVFNDIVAAGFKQKWPITIQISALICQQKHNFSNPTEHGLILS